MPEQDILVGEALRIAIASFGRFLTMIFVPAKWRQGDGEDEVAAQGRDKDKNEVDIVLENRRGEVVGIEVKSSATVSSSDFSGMRKLAAACGDKFIQGIVLYDHDMIVPFAKNMFAAPLSSLWSSK